MAIKESLKERNIVATGLDFIIGLRLDILKEISFDNTGLDKPALFHIHSFIIGDKR